MWNMLFCSYFIFLLRDQWMIERLSKIIGVASVGNNFYVFFQLHWKFHLVWNTIQFSLPKIYKSWKPFWLLNWVSTARIVAHFPQASMLLFAAAATNLETHCVCACLSDQPNLKLCQNAASRAQPLILQSKPSFVFWNSLWEWLPYDWQGLKDGLKLEHCHLTNWL